MTEQSDFSPLFEEIKGFLEEKREEQSHIQPEEDMVVEPLRLPPELSRSALVLPPAAEATDFLDAKMPYRNKWEEIVYKGTAIASPTAIGIGIMGGILTGMQNGQPNVEVVQAFGYVGIASMVAMGAMTLNMLRRTPANSRL